MTKLLCPACCYRYQGLSGFCDRCDAERAVEAYRENREQEVGDQRRRRNDWIIDRRAKEMSA